MAQSSGLTHTLPFGLAIDTGSPDDLQQAQLEARRIRNEANRLDREGWDWDDIKSTVMDNASHVKNTSREIVDKAFGELKRYHKYKDDNWGRPRTHIHDPYPMVMNHGEGYRLFIEGDDTVRFRISAAPHNHVKGELRGSPDHLDRVRTALRDDEWRVGTAELVHKHGEWQLHITVTHENRVVADKHDADTIIGVDVNEDCVALAAMTLDGEVKDTVVLEYPSVKEARHEFFTKRKRMQKADQSASNDSMQSKESDYVHDRLHKVSRDMVDWGSQFSNPLFVFEDLKDMRDDIDYGTRMNRRLHALPFAELQRMASYKAAWEGIPSDKVDPEHTSQRCPRTDCMHIERANRHKKRFDCCACEFQDHSDRKAAVCVVQEWLGDVYGNVPSLETLPRVRKVRRAASGASGGSDPHEPVPGSGVDRGNQHGESARPEMGARGELKTATFDGN